MKTPRHYRKFDLQQNKIAALEKASPRFKRVYDEYTSMSDDLWDLETSDATPVADDFINAIKLQTSYLEDEIEDWLTNQQDHTPQESQ